jgi:single-stranded-DNA-specific exonuclease
MKKWVIKNNKQQTSNLHNNNLISNLLSLKGIMDNSGVEEYLFPDISKLHDPFLLKNMDKAIERIDLAIIKRQKIVIYGDYDVDGITSISILYRAFKKLGVEVGYYIPERMNEGYGINKDAISHIHSLQTDLIITVDCGITSTVEVAYAKALKLDIIITDHHECTDSLPDTIIINPKQRECSYPNKNLAGCGIAFKLVQALWIRYNLHGYEDFLDIAAIGTIADIVELTGENRIIVKNGLSKINNSDKCGIKALKEVAELSDIITSYNIAFQLAPRINAVGRLSDARIAVELFVTNDYDKALQIAKFLDQENRRRQKIEETILNEALEMIQADPSIKKDRIIILSSPTWHHGVVGIVASKIVERYNRPTILLCQDGDKCKGSGRSIKGFNLFESLRNSEDLLIKFGGHEMAAGLTIDKGNVKELKKKVNLLASKLDGDIFINKIYADIVVDTEDVNLETAELMKLFEPFGNGNFAPLFYMENLSIISMKGMGNTGKHLKVYFEKNGSKYEGVLFNGSEEFLNKQIPKADIIFSLDINVWKNNKNLQLMLKAMRSSVNNNKENLHNNYYRYVKTMLVDESSDIEENINKVQFIKKDINFLKDFLYFDRGYILISSLEAIREFELIAQYYEVNSNSNIGHNPQIIICPNIMKIDTFNNDILIYDFLPGVSDYQKLLQKTKGDIYNFFDNTTFNKIDSFIKDIKVDDKFLEIFLKNLIGEPITCTIKELAVKYEKNPYIIYKILMYLKEKGFLEVLIKNDLLKIKRINLNDINFSFEEDNHIKRLIQLKTKFNIILGEK